MAIRWNSNVIAGMEDPCTGAFETDPAKYVEIIKFYFQKIFGDTDESVKACHDIMMKMMMMCMVTQNPEPKILITDQDVRDEVHGLKIAKACDNLGFSNEIYKSLLKLDNWDQVLAENFTKLANNELATPPTWSTTPTVVINKVR